jgi:hypothetical protein
MKVYKAIAEVMRDLGNEGISKSRKNQLQGYSFRGIDEVLNALNPLLAKHGLIICPRVLTRETVERVTAKGGNIFYTWVHAEFDFIAAEDGSKHTVSTFGEGMDSSDKSTNKAMSAAYKYAAFQTFCIPTEAVDSENDHIITAPMPKNPPKPILESVAPAPNVNQGSAKNISEAQIKRLFAICKKSGIPHEDLKQHIKEKYGYESTKDIGYRTYESICNYAENYQVPKS